MRIPAVASALLALLVAACSGTTTYHPIVEGDTARFQDGILAPSPEWVLPDFDDSGWRVGATKVGIGKHVATKVDGMGRDFATLYVRIPFDLGPTAAETETLKMTAPVLGGGYVLYVNGVEVARDGIAVNAALEDHATAAASERELEISVPKGTLRPANNVIAIEARCPPQATEVAVGFQLDAVRPSELQGVIRGPYVQMARADGVTIVYDTATEVAGKVVVDGKTFTGPRETHHEIAVTGLEPGRVYPYHVEAGNIRSEALELTTTPAPGEPVTFVVYGDTRTNGDIHRRVAKAMLSEGADVAINTGDMVATGGNADEWEKFFTIEYAFMARTAVFPSVGNHETNGSGGVDYYKDNFVLPQNSPAPERLYSFDVGDVHLVAIDSNLTLANQVAWVAHDVRKARANGARRVFFYLHHGPYSSGKHGGSGEAQRLLVPLMKELGVDAVFAGHDHIYERGQKDGVRYFVTGGGGAPLHQFNRLASTQKVEARAHYLVVTVAGDRVRIDAKSPDGEIFDSVEW